MSEYYLYKSLAHLQLNLEALNQELYYFLLLEVTCETHIAFTVILILFEEKSKL